MTTQFTPIFRPVSGVRGFTRETLSALIANIESREFRREFAAQNGIPAEHPRSSTTDDVECFFSVLRDMVGKDFTLKQVTCLELLFPMCPSIDTNLIQLYRFSLDGGRCVKNF